MSMQQGFSKCNHFIVGKSHRVPNGAMDHHKGVENAMLIWADEQGEVFEPWQREKTCDEQGEVSSFELVGVWEKTCTILL